MGLHADEVAVDAPLARRLVDEQFPQWTHLELSEAGAGTDNQMFRLGEEYVVRLPRTPGTAAAVAKEQAWIPRLGAGLPVEVPEPVGLGTPTEEYPFAWSVLRWIEGEEPSSTTVRDWGRFGADLAAVVRALHAQPLHGMQRGGSLAWYRGLPLAAMTEHVEEALEECRDLDGLDLDLPAVRDLWRRLVGVPDPDVPHVWTHSDLRAGNLLVRDGRLAAVLDFGGLSIGNPTAEHAAVLEFPRAAQLAYREALDLDDDTWDRARGWKLAISLLSIPYYWPSWREFAQGGVDQINDLLADA